MSTRQRYPIIWYRVYWDLALSVFLVAFAITVGYLFPVLYPLSLWILVNRFMVFLHLTHEALHSNLHPRRRPNVFLGRLFAAPVLVSFRRYQRLHLHHHQYLNQSGVDPDIHLSENFPQSPSRYLLEQLVAFLSLETAAKYFVYYSSFSDFFGKGGKWVSLRVFCAFVLLLSFFFVPVVFFFYFFPLLVYQQYILIVAALQHGPLRQGSVAEMSRDVTGARWLLALFLPCHMNYHGSHHNDPKVPYYWLPQASLSNRDIIWNEPLGTALGTLFIGGR